MQLTQPIADINKLLREHFSTSWDDRPIWRVVFSDDQYENRLTEYTDAGIKLLFPEIRMLPKYKQWVQQKYVLERLVAVPQISQEELTEKTSYEPLYVFERGDTREYLPPTFEAAKFVIDTIYAAQGKGSMRTKYIDPDIDQPQEVRNDRVQKLQAELFGNETDTGDALAHGEGVTVPHNFVKSGDK